MPKGIPRIPRQKKQVAVAPAIVKQRDYPRIPVYEERFICATYCGHFRHNLTLMHRLCFSIMMYFIKKQIMMLPREIDQVFADFKMKPVIFLSVLRNIPSDDNIVVLYPFGYEEFRDIRLDFGRHNVVKDDLALNAFIVYLAALVCSNVFKKTQSFNNCIRIDDLPLLDEAECASAVLSMKCQFILFIDTIFRPSNTAFLMNAFPVMAHLESMRDIAYENFPIQGKKPSE
jgi:hypothetical protein